MPGRMKRRVPRKFLPKMYCGGLDRVANLRRWATKKGLMEHPAIKNCVVVMAALDRFSMDAKRGNDIVNSQAIELLARRVYGTL